uniref:FYVE-type domain-containing protein n=1 Tax=Hyaloperonospora arabidopsidis (strain Emoy2) TaxID=559515 RepID=M4BIL1_HYAAE
MDAYHREQYETQESRESKWKAIKQRHDLTVYRRRKVTSDKEYKYLLTGRMDGTLDEVVMGRYADNTPDFRRLSGVYRQDLVDCAVLGVIKTRSPENPFFLSCFKWMTVESPSKGLVKKRDVCWYEQVGMTRDRNGKEIGYTLTESVELPTCPLFHECVRAKLSVCYLYKRNNSGGVKIFMRGRNDAGGNVAEWVTDLKSADLWLRIEQAIPVAHAVIATALVKAARHVVHRPGATHGKCEVCFTKASRLLSSSKNCAVCHRLTCSTCVTKVRVLNYYDFRVPHYTHFCKKCTCLIHQFDLRAQQSDQNLVRNTVASLTGSESSGNGSERAEGERLYRSAASRASNDSCDGVSFSQPIIGVDYEVRKDEGGYYAHSRQPAPKHPGRSEYHNLVKSSSSSLPAVPVAMSNGLYSHDETSYCPGLYGAQQRRHSHEPPRTTVDQYYAGRDSETPLIWSDDVSRASSGHMDSSDFSVPPTCYRSASGLSADSLITPMLKMNLIAEQSPAADPRQPQGGPSTHKPRFGR